MSGFARHWTEQTAQFAWLLAAGRELDGDERLAFCDEAELFVGEAPRALAAFELEHFESQWLSYEPKADPGGIPEADENPEGLGGLAS